MRRSRFWCSALTILTLAAVVDCSGSYKSGTKVTCENGEKDGTETDVDCGGTACPACVEGDKCNENSDCADQFTCGDAGTCVWSHCEDLTKNGDETDKDCGGSCVACAAGKGCEQNSDCESTLCKSGKCAAASCTDETKNQGESDVDCGDATGICDGCAAGKTCTADANCASGICSNGTCTASGCADSVKNGTEGDVDCGGECTALCAAGSSCSDMTDCVAGVCTKSECQAAACNDGVKNGDETDVDCGGTACDTRCGLGKGCSANSDCAINSCNAGVCEEPSCSNNALDGTETDKDCGGDACSPCSEGLSCALDEDCVSLRCESKVCAAVSCSDQVKNGLETDVDCGGDCPSPCDAELGCGANKDCASGKCSGGVCQEPSCTDDVQNDLETDVDCGGAICVADGLACVNGRSCQEDSDCQSGVCGASTGLCQAQSCADGRKNQDETDIDCGGICSGCAIDQKCSQNSDCASGQCDTDGSGLCLAPTCFDGVKNGLEGAADCGAVCETLCADGYTCNNDADCVSGVCSDTSPGYCLAPTCSDGVKNGNELDTDCLDEENCPEQLCQAGQYCNTIADCDVGTSTEWTCTDNVCTPPGCGDSTLNGNETDIDCGGSDCSACAIGSTCVEDGDCERVTSGNCEAVEGTGYVCAKATCEDGVWNGAESDVDCGGSSCDPCATGDDCSKASDCESGVCEGNLCAEPDCTDEVLNGDETAIDCGGATCAAEGATCDLTEACLLDRDCTSGWCDASSGYTCQTRTCSDEIQNGTETDVDCGGICGSTCDTAEACALDSDCSSGSCSECNGVCILAPSSCYAQDDGCAQCSSGEACSDDFDCESLTCTDGVCAAADNCVGRLLTGAVEGVTVCDTQNTAAEPVCEEYLRCLFVNDCTPSDTCFTDASKACGTNVIGGGTEGYSAAQATWEAAAAVTGSGCS